jgi:hypothetical protein
MCICPLVSYTRIDQEVIYIVNFAWLCQHTFVLYCYMCHVLQQIIYVSCVQLIKYSLAWSLFFALE